LSNVSKKTKNTLAIKKILIVDDDKFILQTMSKALRRVCNFRGEIKTVKSGEDAVEEISNCFYNICFLDIKLPDLNGLDVMNKDKRALA
jgi:two-component SAPR family response regulator